MIKDKVNVISGRYVCNPTKLPNGVIRINGYDTDTGEMDGTLILRPGISPIAKSTWESVMKHYIEFPFQKGDMVELAESGWVTDELEITDIVKDESMGLAIVLTYKYTGTTWTVAYNEFIRNYALI